MKVSQILESRQEQWGELEQLCIRISSGARLNSESVARFSALYRDACADLALASSYQLPEATIDYLQRLVGRSHNLLYRSKGFDWGAIAHTFFVKVPRACFRDSGLHLAFAVFWGFFLFAAYMSYLNQDLADQILSPGYRASTIERFESFEESSMASRFMGACFYIWNNAGIGLGCFATSTLFVPGLVTLMYNAIVLGSTFGFMFHPDAGIASVHFRNFVTAHGPFELTAIVLSSGAGLKIGMAWVKTNGLSRIDSITRAGQEAIPMVGCAVALFVGAAMIEGFISPSSLPWAFKAFVAISTSVLLVVYFVVLGFPRGGPSEA